MQGRRDDTVCFLDPTNCYRRFNGNNQNEIQQYGS